MECAIQFLSAVGMERPAVCTIAHEFENGLAITTSKDGKSRGERLVDYQAPGVSQSGKDENSGLRVELAEIRVRHIAKKLEFEIGGQAGRNKVLAVRCIAGKPKVAGSVRGRFRP